MWVLVFALIATFVIAALLPFGKFVNDRFLARKHRELSA